MPTQVVIANHLGVWGIVFSLTFLVICSTIRLSLWLSLFGSNSEFEKTGGLYYEDLQKKKDIQYLEENGRGQPASSAVAPTYGEARQTASE